MRTDKRRIYGDTRSEKQMLTENLWSGMLGFALMASIGLWVWLRPISTPEHPMRVFALVIMVAFSVGLVIVAISDTIRAYRDVKSRDEYLAAAQTANE